MLDSHEAHEIEKAVANYYRSPGASDPQALYPRLRSQDPFRQPEIDMWIVSRHADAVAVLKGGQTVRTPPASAEPDSELEGMLRYFFTAVGPDEHRRMRQLVQAVFTPRAVRAFESNVRLAVEDVLDTALAQGGMDIVQDLAGPLPAGVICRLLGLPYEDHVMIGGWVSDVLKGYLPGAAAVENERAEISAGKFTKYMWTRIEERRREPGDDLISSLIAIAEDGERLSGNELHGAACHILHAGIHTSVNAIGNMILTLLEHPDQLRRVASDRTLVPNAVEECLRFSPPVITMPMRQAVADIPLNSEVVIPQGHRLTVWIGAANRDPQVFEAADDVDVARNHNPHLAFSTGVNNCLGAHLARVELRVVLETVVNRMPNLKRVSHRLEYDNVALGRGLKSLRVSC
jgi:cytochrome P450 family 107 subfamily K polypeptide 1